MIGLDKSRQVTFTVVTYVREAARARALSLRTEGISRDQSLAFFSLQPCGSSVVDRRGTKPPHSKHREGLSRLVRISPDHGARACALIREPYGGRRRHSRTQAACEASESARVRTAWRVERRPGVRQTRLALAQGTATLRPPTLFVTPIFVTYVCVRGFHTQFCTIKWLLSPKF